MPELLWLAFWSATSSGALLVMLLILSIALPAHRIWPPPNGRASWQFWLVWTLVMLLIGGDVTVAVLDRGTLGLRAAYVTVGIGLIVLGNGLAWWGVAVLGGRATTGRAGALATTGPYRFSRNPQYAGDVVIAIGVVLASDSALSLWPSLLAAVSAIAAPFAEEPWLRRRLGPDYEAYLHRVPRFLSPFF